MPLALKIDVDTYDGLKNGAPLLARFLRENKIPASFFVTLGPDTSGRAAFRVFRQKGFLNKMRRTRAASVYGLRTILSGTLLPARPMGLSFADSLRELRDWGFEVSPHGYDHIAWHDQAARWDEARAAEELAKLTEIYRNIFGEDPTSFAAPGWQAGAGTWKAMEKSHLLYHSDTRGTHPYLPRLAVTPADCKPSQNRGQSHPVRTQEGGTGSIMMDPPLTTAGDDGVKRDTVLRTLEIPTTLPTWDEMLSWPEINRHNLVEETWKLIKPGTLNVWTIHAEIEGSAYFPQFHEFVERAQDEHLVWAFLPDVARSLQGRLDSLPCDTIKPGTLPGRAGTVTCQVPN